MKCEHCGSECSGNVCKICEIPVRTPKPKKTGINKISEKQKELNKEKAKQIRQHKKERVAICSGCEDGEKKLTNSHLIPVSRRKDLELNKVNQVWHCVDCHPIWEHDKQGRKLLKDYQKNMLIIKMLDTEYYELLISKHGL